MFYKLKIVDYIRVPPHLFTLDLKDAVIERLKNKYTGLISNSVGIIVDVVDVLDISDGIIIEGDGAVYYKIEFTVLSYIIEMHEVVYGRVRDIADFGAFLNIGVIDAMVHISQTMDDFVSFSESKVLVGRDKKKILKVNDLCKGKIVAISYKDLNNPKIGLTMRSEGLGCVNW